MATVYGYTNAYLSSVLNFTFTNYSSGGIIPKDMIASNASLVNCDEKVNDLTCSCSDCLAVCPAAPTIPPDKGPAKVTFIPLGIFVGVIGFAIYNIENVINGKANDTNIVFVMFAIVYMYMTAASKNKEGYDELSETPQRHFF